MSEVSTDQTRKELTISAPLDRVWSAINDPAEFGAWFKVDLTGVVFQPGATARDSMTYPGYEGMPFEMEVERVEPPRHFSFRWHPYSPDPDYDASQEPMTLVEFQLEEVAEGTLLTVIESGFDALPLWRRAEAFRMNSEGWTMQLLNIASHVAAAPS